MNGRSILQIFICAGLLLAAPLLPRGYAAQAAEFNGTWLANGTQAPFPFLKGRQVYTFRFGGHVSLQTPLEKKKDYWADCIGLADSSTGLVGRCVWKDLAGPEIYLTIQSDRMQQGSQVRGAIVGGTGHLAGISGDVSFNWSSVIVLTDADGTVTVTGQTQNLSGRYRLP